MPRIVFTVNEEMEQDLKRLAEEQGNSLSSLIRRYLESILADETGKSPDVYRVEAQKSNADSQTAQEFRQAWHEAMTGQSIPLEEVLRNLHED